MQQQEVQKDLNKLIRLTDSILSNMQNIKDEDKIRKNILKVQKINQAHNAAMSNELDLQELRSVFIYCNEQLAKMTQLQKAIKSEKDENK